MSDRINFKSAGAIRKWAIRRIGQDGEWAVLRHNSVVHVCQSQQDAHRYIQTQEATEATS